MRSFRFQEILRMTDDSLRYLVMQIPTQTLAPALHNMPNELAERVFSILPRGGAATVRAAMRELQSPSADMVSSAQVAIVRVALALAEEGRLELPPPEADSGVSR